MTNDGNFDEDFEESKNLSKNTNLFNLDDFNQQFESKFILHINLQKKSTIKILTELFEKEFILENLESITNSKIVTVKIFKLLIKFYFFSLISDIFYRFLKN